MAIWNDRWFARESMPPNNFPQKLIEPAQSIAEEWLFETTFQEMRAYLGLETTRGWTEKTVLRVAPCLFGLYTVVAALYVQRPGRFGKPRLIPWPGKQDVTFSEAITAVRRWLWVEWVFAIPGQNTAFSKLKRPFREMLLAGLAPAA